MEELDKFMGCVRNDPMYFLIYALATRVGLSASSILRIKEGDVLKEDFTDAEGNSLSRTFLRLDGSGFTEDRYVVLPNDVAELFDRYLAVVTPIEGKIFLNQHNHPLTLKNLDSATERFIRQSGIKRCTMKDLRSRAILELIKSGNDLDSIKEYTGLSYMRINTLASSKHLVDRKCPADLVNYELKIS